MVLVFSAMPFWHGHCGIIGMIRKIILTSLICWIAAGADARGWTMEECMDYAVGHAYSVKTAVCTEAGAAADRREAAAAFLPSISASSGVNWGWGRNVDPETNTYNDVTTFSNDYSVSAGLTLIDGGRTINRWKQARVELRRSRNATRQQRDDCAIATMLAFVDAVYRRGATAIAAERLAHSSATLRLVERQFELGLKAEPDVATARAAVAGDSYTLTHERNLMNQAMLALRSAMNYPAEAALELDTLCAATNPELSLDDADAIYSYAAGANPRALVAAAEVESNRLQLRIARGAWCPTVSVRAGISTSFYRNFGQPHTSFSDQFRNNRGEYLAASISIPLFDNLQRATQVRRAGLALEKARIAREETLRKLHDDIAAAIMDRDGYAMEIMSLATKTEADSAAHRLSVRKYEEGLISLIDMQLTATAYFDSRLALLQRRMLYILKQKMVAYYKGDPLTTE